MDQGQILIMEKIRNKCANKKPKKTTSRLSKSKMHTDQSPQKIDNSSKMSRKSPPGLKKQNLRLLSQLVSPRRLEPIRPVSISTTYEEK